MYSLKITEKNFDSIGDLCKFIKTEKSNLIKLKKLHLKSTLKNYENDFVSKFEPKINASSDIIQVKAVINTTNYIDSHDDLHLPKLWNKSVADKPISYHLDQHKSTFEGVLSGDAKHSIETYKFNELGYDSDMDAQALVSNFVLNRKSNPFIFDAYMDGKVKQHSVGMQYVDIDVVYKDEENEEENLKFEKYSNMAANKELADELGYFFIVTQAKRHEGSAVLFGSNPITPTLEIKDFEPTNKVTQARYITKNELLTYLKN